MSGRPRRVRHGVTLTLVFGTVLACGAATGSWNDVLRRAEQQRAAQRTGGLSAASVVGTAQIAEAIQQGKVGPQGAAALVTRSGDRWSAFYSAQEYEGLRRALDGRYVGVGLWVRREPDGRIDITRVQPGSPAARARILPGDRLRAVDGTAVTGRPVTDVVSRLRGPGTTGTPVTLGLQRGTHGWDAHLRRALLVTQSVTVRRLPGRVAYVKIDSFTKGVARQVRRSLHGDTSGVLLDLRGNSGGLVTEAVGVASAFLDGGLVATYDVHGEQQALYAEAGGDTRTPLVVLVDGGTMSAAELLAGALQDRGRAVVIGSRTFGKGSVQMPSSLSDGSVAELTVGHYRLPSGAGVDGQGIDPDLKVTAGEDAVGEAREVLSGLGTRS